MTLSEAKQHLHMALKGHAEFRGIGLGKDTIKVLWAENPTGCDIAIKSHGGWPVEVTYVGEIKAL